MIIRQIKSPILPRNKKDPTQSSRVITRIFGEIDQRYKAIADAINGRMSRYQVRASNADAQDYIYSIPPDELARLFEFINSVLQDNLLDGMLSSGDGGWIGGYLDDEFLRGTQFSFTNLSSQSERYKSETNIHMLMSSPGYLNQVQTARVMAYSEWKGVSDKARSQLADTITTAVVNGTNVRDTAAAIEQRLNVSKVDARKIAQTEQLGAYRQAQRNETKWSKDRLGMNTAMLHLSALLPTSRVTHVERHGHIYTPEEVADWYSVDGNRYNCHCTQIPVVLDDDGNLVNTGMVNRLTAERDKWTPLARKVKK